MPTIADIYRTLKEHEEHEKTATEKKAIANPAGGAGASVSDAIENVLGPSIAETKVRIKKKLEEVAGQQKAVEGLGSNREDEHPASTQTPQTGDQMPPGGSAKAAAAPAKAEEKKAAPEAEKQAKDMPAAFKAYLDKKKGEKKKADETKPAEEDAEKVAAEKVAAEYYAAGQIMAQGFAHELNRLMSEEK